MHPRHILTGFDDQSARAPLAGSDSLPIHLPLFFTFAKEGQFTPQLTAGLPMINHYGEETFDLKSKFTTHASPFIVGTNGFANQMLIHRLRAPGVAQATLRISLDLLAVEMPIYERDEGGNFRVDVNGDLIPTGQTTPGYVGKYVLGQISDNLGGASVSPGSMSEAGVQSILYPIADVPASSFGSGGNGTGLRLSAPNERSLEPIDTELAQRQKGYIYRLEVVKRSTERTTPVVTKTLTAERYVEFSLNPEAFDDRFDGELFADKKVLPAYRDIEDFTTGLPAYGPFEAFHFYHENIATVSKAIQEKEAPVNNDIPAGEESCYLINILSARNFNGSPYQSFALRGSMENEPEFTDISTHYLFGGKDGDTSNKAFNVAVKEQLDNFGTLGTTYLDNARYPFSVFYDSGFDIDTKKAIGKVLGARQDVHVCVSTQDVSIPQLSVSQESSMAVSLRASLRLIPESILYGTPCCRAVVMGQSGYIIGSKYSELVPVSYELCMKRARYMGASTGTMNTIRSYDEDPLNHIEFLRGLNNTWSPETVRNKDWDAGLVTARYYDHKRLHIPAVQTVYDDDSSVLNSDINMQIAVELNKVSFRVWRELVGNSKLTKQQFIERSNEKIVAKTQDRFDGRVVIVPETYYSPADKANGASWSVRLHMYANTNPTVAMSTVVTHRLEDLKS